MAVEKCWVLLGGIQDGLWWGKMSHETSGMPCSVDFNYDWTLHREETKQDIRGWAHTHPNMIASPSCRDDRTMKAWVCSFGKPLVCCIAGIDGLKAWWYLNDEDPPLLGRSVKRLGHYIVGVTNSIEVKEYSLSERCSC